MGGILGDFKEALSARCAALCTKSISGTCPIRLSITQNRGVCQEGKEKTAAKRQLFLKIR